MTQKTKNINRKVYFSIFVLTLFLGFGFGGVGKASATNCQCVERSGTTATDTGGSTTNQYSPIIGTQKDVATQQDCLNSCKAKHSYFDFGGNVYFTVNGKPASNDTNGDASNKTPLTSANLSSPKEPDVCSWGEIFSFKIFICLFLVILKFVGWLLSLAATIFTLIVDPKIFDTVVRNNPAIWQSWKIVRDLLNIVFILVLLFSAFATVFQIDKYSYKKVLLNVILMALLVNFSFPIARFIVDFGNSNMYFLLNNLKLGNASLFADIAKDASIVRILNYTADSGATSILAAIVFCFILAITLLAIGILLVVRVVALAFLIIISPIGFVAVVIPGSEKMGSDWWTSLIEYTMFGPTMAFFLYIATQMMTVFSSPTMQGYVTAAARKDAPGNLQEIIIAFATFLPPIIILWAGIGFAKKSSVAGASMVMGQAEKALNWSGRTLTGYRLGKTLAGAGATRIERRMARGKYSKFLVPRVYKEAWERRSKDAETKAYQPAIGSMQNLFNKVLGGPQTDYLKLENARLVANQMKELSEVSQQADFIMDDGLGNMTKGKRERITHLRSMFGILNNNKDYDELMDRIRGNLDSEAWEGGPTWKDMGFDLTNTTVAREDVINAVVTLMRRAGADEKEIVQQVMDMGNVSAGNGGNLYGGVAYDSDNKDFRLTGADEGAFIFARKLRTAGEAQDLAKKMHRTIFTDQHGTLTRSGKESLVHVINEGITKNADRSRPDFSRDVAGNDAIYNQIMDFANEVRQGTARLWNPHIQDPTTGRYGMLTQQAANPEQANIIQRWANANRLRTGKATRPGTPVP